MNKTVERLAFMFIGALLVSVAYFVGNADKTANAEIKDFDDVVIRGNLFVHGAISVGDINSEHRNFVAISANESGASIDLMHNFVDGDTNAQIILGTHDKEVAPFSGIILSAKSGKTIYATSDEKGWFTK